jgi:hypothetical protein
MDRKRVSVEASIGPLSPEDRERALATERQIIDDMMYRGRALPILPEHMVYVFQMSVPWDGPRFVKQFLEVWDRLPADIRDCILAHWCKDCPDTPVNPTIQLTDDGTRRKVYWTDQHGCRLSFYAPAMAAMSDNAAKFLIAERLMEVLGKAGVVIDSDSLIKQLGFRVEEDEGWCFHELFEYAGP